MGERSPRSVLGQAKDFEPLRDGFADDFLKRALRVSAELPGV